MPISYNILSDDRVVRVTAEGTVDLRTVLESIGRVEKDPSFDPELNIVVDARQMEYSPSLGELRVLAWALLHERPAWGRNVAVVRPAGVLRARQRLFAAFSRMVGPKLGFFPDEQAALDWLHVQASPNGSG